MPTQCHFVLPFQDEKPFRSNDTFVLTLDVCPTTRSVERISLEATCKPLLHPLRADIANVYSLRVSDDKGKLADVFVVVQNSDRSAAVPAQSEGGTPIEKRRPRPPGLCGGVIADSAPDDNLALANPRMRGRIEREYQTLLERIRRTSSERAALA
jgi:hypothetical protein